MDAASTMHAPSRSYVRRPPANTATIRFLLNQISGHLRSLHNLEHEAQEVVGRERVFARAKLVQNAPDRPPELLFCGVAVVKKRTTWCAVSARRLQT